MMVTIFPILVRLGVSPVGAAAAVATGHLLDIGPASATSLLVSKTVGLGVEEYFVGYQLKVYIICGIVTAVAHYIWQQYMDKKIRSCSVRSSTYRSTRRSSSRTSCVPRITILATCIYVRI